MFQMSVESSGPITAVPLCIRCVERTGSSPGSRGAKGANVPLFIYMGVGDVWGCGGVSTHLKVSYSSGSKTIEQRNRESQAQKFGDRSCRHSFWFGKSTSHLKFPNEMLWFQGQMLWISLRLQSHASPIIPRSGSRHDRLSPPTGPDPIPARLVLRSRWPTTRRASPTSLSHALEPCSNRPTQWSPDQRCCLDGAQAGKIDQVRSWFRSRSIRI